MHRVLPGSHARSLEEVTAELRAIPGNDEEEMFAKHPDEQIVPLDPESHVVWSPPLTATLWWPRLSMDTRSCSIKLSLHARKFPFRSAENP